MSRYDDNQSVRNLFRNNRTKTPSYLPFILLMSAAIFLLVLFLIGAALSGGLMPNYSEGERSGQVYKVSYKGILFKSYEGEMNVGGMATDANGQATANKFAFSVTDPAVVQALKEAATSGKRVTLTYKQYLISPVTLSTDYVIVAVKGMETTGK